MGLRFGPLSGITLATALACSFGPGAAFADPGRVLSTGIGSNGHLIPIGQADDDWRLVQAPNGVAPGPVTVVAPSRPYFADFAESAQWVSPNAQTHVDAPFGLYTYEISFGGAASAMQGRPLVGRYASDNRLIEIRANGQVGFIGPQAGMPCPSPTCSGEEFRQPIDFQVPASLFVNGRNTLSVTIENLGPSRGNPTSFAFAAVLPVSPIPEPPAALMLAAGLAGLVSARRHRSRRV